MERRADPEPLAPTSSTPGFLRLDEQAQLELLALLPDHVLQRVEADYCPAECDCPLEFAPCGCPEGVLCQCPAVPLPCQHVLEAAGRPWLSPAVVAYVLWRLHPQEYAEPPPPAKPSCNTNRDAQVGIYASRAQRKPPRGIRHPGDWLALGLEAVEPKLGRQPIRLRNGADLVGPLRLLSTHQSPLTPHPEPKCA